LFDGNDSSWLHEHPSIRCAIEVSLPSHLSIIFATLIFKFHSHPVSIDKVHGAYEPHGCQAAIGELDDLADRELRHDVQIIDEIYSLGSREGKNREVVVV